MRTSLPVIWGRFSEEEPHALSQIDWLPDDTALATFGDFDISGVWKMLKKEADSAGIPELKMGLDQLDSQVKRATGMDLGKLLIAFSGEQGILLTLNSSQKVQLPIGGAHIEIPEPALLIAVKVKNDDLFNIIDAALKNAPVKRSDDDGIRARTMTVNLPLPIAFSPTVARYGDYLFLASNLEIVRTVMEVKTGKRPGLKANEEFKRLSKGMPTEGNEFSFVSERFGTAVRDIQQKALGSAGGPGRDKATAALMQRLFQAQSPVSSYSVEASSKDGWFVIGHGSQQPATMALAPLIAVPAIAAAMVLPALAKARANAQNVQATTNARRQQQMQQQMQQQRMQQQQTLPPGLQQPPQ